MDPVPRLVDLCDSWQAGNVVEPHDSEFVGHEFVLPNLLTHLFEVLKRIFTDRNALLTRNITYDDLFRAWHAAAPNDSGSSFAALHQELETEFREGLSRYHPWRCVDALLVLEAYAVQLSTGHALSFAAAWRILDDAIPPKSYLQFDLPPAALGKLTEDQIRDVLKEFFEPALKKWTRDGGTWLHDLLTDVMRMIATINDPRVVRVAIHSTLGLVPQSFMDQTKYVAKQRGENLERLRTRSHSTYKLGLPEPLNDKWLRRISAELVPHYETKRGFRWHGEDLRNLKILMEWIDAKNLEAHRPAQLDDLRTIAAATFSYQTSFNPVAGQVTIAEALSAWDRLLLLVRTRWRRKGFMLDWGNRDSMIENLFCHPLIVRGKVVDWDWELKAQESGTSIPARDSFDFYNWYKHLQFKHAPKGGFQ